MNKSFFLVLSLVYTIALNAQFSIQDVLSAPFPTNMVGSKDGKHIAWVFNDRGERNIFLASAPDFKAIKLTTFAGDNGTEISDLSFDDQGIKLMFVRGNTPNKNGDPANPALLNEVPERTIFVANLTSKNINQIAKGYAPQFMNAGARIMYIQKNQAYTIDEKQDVKPEPLCTLRGGISGLNISPDNQHVAFVSNRGDHSFIGLFDIKNKTLFYPDPSIDIDNDPAWSPDGRYVAFTRVPFDGSKMIFTPARASLPWSILVYDTKEKTTKQVWKADEGDGSVLVRDLPTSQKLLWNSQHEIIFPWEKTGWLLLYAVSISTKETKLLTPGTGEVENALMSHDHSRLLYSSNILDRERRQISEYNFNDKSTKHWMSKDISWSSTLIEGGLAFLHATHNKPPWPMAIMDGGKIKKLAPELFPTSFPEQQLVTPQLVQITATDGKLSPAQLFVTSNVKTKEKKPALIFLHGGSRRQMLLGFQYGQYYAFAYALNQYFASKGYVVLSLNFRSGIGYGLHFREAEAYGASGGSEFRDVMGAGLYLKSREDVDPTKITLWGGSYGGFLTAMGLSRASDLFACGVDIHGVHDWNEGIRNFVPGYDPEKMPQFRDLAFRSSPEHTIDTWKSPVLLIHGDDDRNVNFTETVRLAEKLRRKGVYFEQVVFPDEVHGFLLHKNWVKAYESSFDFIERMLKR